MNDYWKGNFIIATSEFPPEPGVSGRMAYDVAVHLVQKGHNATVICPYPTRPAGAVYENRYASIVSHEDAEGVKVIRVPSFRAPQSRFLPRMKESWSFGSWTARFIKSSPWPVDCLYSSTWPMLGQSLTTYAASRLRIPHLTHIMDLYPESALLKVSSGVHFLTARPLLALDRWNAAAVTRLLVISESMVQAYTSSRGIPRDRIELVPVWQDERPYLRLPSRFDAAKFYNIDPKPFTFLFLGNMGPVAGVDHVIHSFASAGLQGCQLVLVGEGTEKARCMEIARSCKAPIHFISDPRIENVPKLQSLADVCLLPMKRGTAYSSIPSKLVSYMLTGKPVLACVDSESDSARLITTAGCGWIIPPEDRDALAREMGRLFERPNDQLAQAGLRGRTFALTHLSKTRGVERLAEMMLSQVPRRLRMVEPAREERIPTYGI